MPFQTKYMLYYSREYITHAHRMLEYRHCVQFDAHAREVDWYQRPSEIQTELLNPSALDQYLEKRMPYIHLETTAHNRRLLVNDKQERNLQVRLHHVLQNVDRERTMLFTFPDQNYAQADFERFILDHHAYVLVRLVRGPNFHEKKLQLQDIKKVVPSLKKVIWVVGFAEAIGSQMGYTKEHVAELLAVLQSAPLKGLQLGVFLAAEHHASTYGLFEMQALKDQPNVKYMFVNAIQRKWKWQEGKHDRNLKWNLNKMQILTFLMTDWHLRECIYKINPNLAGPIITTTTTPSTTEGSTDTPTTTTEPPSTTPSTPSTPPTPNLDNASLSSVELQSPTTPSTTMFTLDHSKVTFPTVKNAASPLWQRMLLWLYWPVALCLLVLLPRRLIY